MTETKANLGLMEVRSHHNASHPPFCESVLSLLRSTLPHIAHNRFPAIVTDEQISAEPMCRVEARPTQQFTTQ